MEIPVTHRPAVEWEVAKGQFDLYVVRPAGMVAYGVGFSFPDEREAKLLAHYLNDPPGSSEKVYRHFKKLRET
jgi:hypothetical protein